MNLIKKAIAHNDARLAQHAADLLRHGGLTYFKIRERFREAAAQLGLTITDAEFESLMAEEIDEGEER